MTSSTQASMADRIRDAMGNDGPYDVSRRLQRAGAAVTPQSIYAWLAGGDVREDNLQAFAREYGITPAWLRYGVGERAAVSSAAAEAGRMIEAMPEDIRQETLDFIGYKLSRPNVQIAEETRASYARFLQLVREDLARRKGGS